MFRYRNPSNRASAVYRSGCRPDATAAPDEEKANTFVISVADSKYFMQARNDASQCPEGRKECATQTFYYLPGAWLQPAGGSNTLTVFEAGGIGAVAGNLRSAGLALATVRAAQSWAYDNDDLSSVTSCEF